MEDELIKELLLSMSRFIWAIARPNRVLFVISRYFSPKLEATGYMS